MSLIARAVEAAKSKAATPVPAQPVPPQHSQPAALGEVVRFSILQNRGTVVSESVDRELFEQFRRIKRPLLQATFGPLMEANPHGVVMVTSPLQGAGKTFVSINLANVLAMEKDLDVLLIDTDNVQSSLTRQLGLAGQLGLFDLINDASKTAEEAICPTDIPRLSILPAGQTVNDSLEWLNSSRCHEIFQQIGARSPAQIIILDGPPLLVSSDGPAIARFAGQILLIVEAGVTPKSAVSKSLDLLDRDKPIGLILNKTSGKLDHGFYYARPDTDSTAE